mgnify:CR=1 FL=1
MCVAEGGRVSDSARLWGRGQLKEGLDLSIYLKWYAAGRSMVVGVGKRMKELNVLRGLAVVFAC